jgi:hypothetical protein
MTVTPAPAGAAPLHPEDFFLGQTVGSGVIRDPLARIVRRFRVETRGHEDGSYGAFNLDETYAFDTGEVDVLRWVVSPGGDGRYVLAEASLGSGILAQQQRGEFSFAYRRPFGAARGPASPRFSVRMTLLAPDTVLRMVRICLLGAPLGAVTAIHQRP